jgi:hypothetical protein
VTWNGAAARSPRFATRQLSGAAQRAFWAAMHEHEPIGAAWGSSKLTMRRRAARILSFKVTLERSEAGVKQTISVDRWNRSSPCQVICPTGLQARTNRSECLSCMYRSSDRLPDPWRPLPSVFRSQRPQPRLVFGPEGRGFPWRRWRLPWRLWRRRV